MLPGGAHGKRKGGRLSSASTARVGFNASRTGVMKRTLRKLRPRTAVSGLRAVWLLAVAWYELGVFHWSVSRCRWPDSVLQGPSAAKAHILLVADPQILDMHSYPERGLLLSAVSQLIVDLNLRKSWGAMGTWLLSQSGSTDAQEEGDAKEAVVFLGDMMDSGRSAYTDEEYQQYFDRFKSIFPTSPSTRVYYIPGNHDVGLGASHRFSPQAKARYVEHFGELNYLVSMNNHTLVMLDAPGLVEEDYRRANAKTRFEDWIPKAGSPIDFVQKYASVGNENPAILFTHIPLHRPEKAGCGPLREKGSIRRGVGFGYQNTLGRITSQFLLKNIRPIGVYSGDDHDYCEYTHSIPLLSEAPNPEIFDVREVTVKSLSMAMGIQQPGFQLLSLVDPHSIPSNAPSAADDICILPDQLAIYLLRYLPLFLFTLLVLAVSTLRKYQALTLGHSFSSETDASERGSNVAASPESSYSTGPLSSARMPSASSGSRSGRSAAPHLRASSASLAPPQTPDTYAFDSMTPPHTAGRAPSGLLSTPLSGTTFEELENGADEGMMVNQMSRYRRSSYFGDDDEAEGGGISVPFIGRVPWSRNRRRWMAWTWTFTFRGRRSRFTIGVPPLLEQIIIRFVNKGWGRLSGRRDEEDDVRLSRGGHVGGGTTNPASIFARDFLSAAFLPITLFVLINWYILRS